MKKEIRKIVKNRNQIKNALNKRMLEVRSARSADGGFCYVCE